MEVNLMHEINQICQNIVVGKAYNKSYNSHDLYIFFFLLFWGSYVVHHQIGFRKLLHHS